MARVEGETSAAVIILTLAAAAATLCAFWMSILRQRAFRRLVRWIRERHPERWPTSPWRTRWRHPTAIIETLRRQQLGQDQEFMSLYAEGKRHARRQIIFILIGVVLIGVLLIGVRYGGWR